MKVSLDPLPLKRILAIEESGLELYPPDVAQEDRPLSLLQSIDFEQPAAKKTKKDAGASQTWRWQGVVDQLRQAQEELVTLMDFIHHVEAKEVLNVVHSTKPNRLPHEACADLALRISSKTRKYKDIAKYFKTNVSTFERRVEKEAVFYGALMRLQRNWKIKRQRKMPSGPAGGEADFTVDLSFPLGTSLMPSARTLALSSVTVAADPNGLLTPQIPPGRSIKSLQFSLCDGGREMNCRRSMTTEPKQGEEPLAASNARFRSLQLSILDEMLFESLSREALQPSSGLMSLTQINDATLQVGLGDSLSATFRLVDNSGVLEDESKETSTAEAGSSVLLREGFLSMVLAQKGVKSSGKENSLKLLKRFSDRIRHRLAAAKVVSLLEKLIFGVPQMWFQSHPTWKPCISAWDVYFDIPQAVLKGDHVKLQEWGSLTRVSRVTFQCMLVLRDETVTVEGLDGFLPLGKGTQSYQSAEFSPMTSYRCSLSELPAFLLTQVSGKIVRWLLEEAVLLGSKVNLTLLSLNFDLEKSGQVSLVAAPSSQSINWWLRLFMASSEEPATQLKDKESLSRERFLGPLPLEALRAVVMDLLSLTSERR